VEVEVVFYNLRRNFNEWRFDFQCSAILKTPPVKTTRDGLILFSMMGHRVLIPYLIGAKSLRQKINMGRFVILDDGTLTAADKATLKHHLDDPEIIPISSVVLGPCPKGGTWERLITVLTLAKNDYVVQMDSDVLCLQKPTAVIDAIGQNRDFTILGEQEAAQAGITAASDISMPQHGISSHIQILAERTMMVMPRADQQKYVRGCSGFAGFSKGRDRLTQLFDFADYMGKAVGPRWKEWGTEQVSSNYIIANGDNPLLLDYQYYMNHEGWTTSLDDARYAGSAHIMHFISPFRYGRGRYIEHSRTVIKGLLSA
jgi:hypothetical protein